MFTGGIVCPPPMAFPALLTGGRAPMVMPLAFMPEEPLMPGNAPVLGIPVRRPFVPPGPPAVGAIGARGGVEIAGLAPGLAMPGRTGFRSGSIFFTPAVALAFPYNTDLELSEESDVQVKKGGVAGNEELARVLASDKVDLNKMASRCLQKLAELLEVPHENYGNGHIRSCLTATKILHQVTSFMRANPGLSEEQPKAAEDQPKVTGAKQSKVERKKDLVPFKMPRPSDFSD